MQPPRDFNHEEIIRLRERTHTLANTSVALRWSIDRLEEWSKETDERLRVVDQVLDGVVKQDEIAAALRQVQQEGRKLGLTRFQTVAVSVAALAAVASPVIAVLR